MGAGLVKLVLETVEFWFRYASGCLLSSYFVLPYHVPYDRSIFKLITIKVYITVLMYLYLFLINCSVVSEVAP